MSENQTKILDMLAQGKISVAEAQRLLSLLNTERETPDGNIGSTKNKVIPRYLHVIVEPKPGAQCHSTGTGTDRDFHGKVNVRVPFGLIRAGIKLATLIPSETAGRVNEAMKEKGMDFDLRRMKPEDIEELIIALRDSEVNLDSDNETIRIYAE